MLLAASLAKTMIIRFFADLLIGKNVLVTGASRGIGRELALNYCRMGANVFITARDEKKLTEVIVLDSLCG